MGQKNVYLTMKEKRELALDHKEVPLCVIRNPSKNSFIAKMCGYIFDDTLKNKKFSI